MIPEREKMTPVRAEAAKEHWFKMLAKERAEGRISKEDDEALTAHLTEQGEKQKIKASTDPDAEKLSGPWSKIRLDDKLQIDLNAGMIVSEEQEFVKLVEKNMAGWAFGRLADKPSDDGITRCLMFMRGAHDLFDQAFYEKLLQYGLDARDREKYALTQGAISMIRQTMENSLYALEERILAGDTSAVAPEPTELMEEFYRRVKTDVPRVWRISRATPK